MVVSQDASKNSTLNIFNANTDPVLIEGIIENPTTGTDYYIDLGNDYFEKHPYPFDSNLVSVTITAVNGTEQQTENQISLEIPSKYMEEYLYKLEEAQETEDEQSDGILGIQIGN